jgi:hypothetical protein
MTEQMKFCGTISLAARKMGIRAKWENGAIVWADPVTRVRFSCPHEADRKEAFHAACLKLVEYLNK